MRSNTRDFDFRENFDLSLTYVLPYRSAYYCVGWHAVVCYGALNGSRPVLE
jgi:hypothetical protein